MAELGKPLDLDPIKARINALSEHATTGDWHYDGSDVITVFPAVGGQAELVADLWAEPGSEEERAIGEFIAHSRQDVDALLTEVNGLRSREHALAEEVSGLRDEVELLRKAGELMGRTLQSDSQDVINVCAEVVQLRQDSAELEQMVAELTAKNLDLLAALGERVRVRAETAARHAGVWDGPLTVQRITQILGTVDVLEQRAAEPITASQGSEEFAETFGWVRGTRNALTWLAPRELAAEVLRLWAATAPVPVQDTSKATDNAEREALRGSCADEAGEGL